jgi:DNA-directed RNA polymerase specialized sigma24 family protein
VVTTTRRECARTLRTARAPQAAGNGLDIEVVPDERTMAAEQELLAAERYAAVHEAFARLPPRCQQLLSLLVADSPVPYAQISTRLGIPVGAIGPNRGRCLDKLRRDPAIAALMTGIDA